MGFDYLIMEFVPGGSLHEAQREQANLRIPVEQCLRWMRQAAEGMSEAEVRGILHRDLKPENLLLDDNRDVKIADFGLAKLLTASAQSTALSEITDPRMPIGTLLYMSPEQSRGEAVDHRSDIYSLGATFYCMLTGKAPIVDVTSQGILLRKSELPFLDCRQIVRDGSIPEELSQLIERMTSQLPSGRPESFPSVARALRRIEGNRSTPPRRGSSSRPAGEVPGQAELLRKPLAPRYRILRSIGAGAMGEVFEALDTESNENVAIKRLHPHSDDDDRVLERFMLEARSIQRLRHPNIVEFIDFAIDDDGPWVAMELVPSGRTLKEFILEGGPLREQEFRGLAGQLFDAIQHAHENSVVHRDLKPSNILVAPDGKVKLADFGLARHGLGAMGSSSLSALGTPEYAAPEQYRRPREVDHRSDIFSLGKVFYFVLCRESPITLRESLIPAAFRKAVLQAVAEEQRDRFGWITEFRRALLSPHDAAETSTLACPECSAPVDLEWRFCGRCQSPLQQACPSCGFDRRVGTEFCPHCGISVGRYRKMLSLRREGDHLKRNGRWKVAAERFERAISLVEHDEQSTQRAGICRHRVEIEERLWRRVLALAEQPARALRICQIITRRNPSHPAKDRQESLAHQLVGDGEGRIKEHLSRRRWKQAWREIERVRQLSPDLAKQLETEARAAFERSARQTLDEKIDELLKAGCLNEALEHCRSREKHAKSATIRALCGEKLSELEGVLDAIVEDVQDLILQKRLVEARHAFQRLNSGSKRIPAIAQARKELRIAGIVQVLTRSAYLAAAAVALGTVWLFWNSRSEAQRALALESQAGQLLATFVAPALEAATDPEATLANWSRELAEVLKTYPSGGELRSALEEAQAQTAFTLRLAGGTRLSAAESRLVILRASMQRALTGRAGAGGEIGEAFADRTLNTLFVRSLEVLDRTPGLERLPAIHETLAEGAILPFLAPDAMNALHRSLEAALPDIVSRALTGEAIDATLDRWEEECRQLSNLIGKAPALERHAIRRDEIRTRLQTVRNVLQIPLEDWERIGPSYRKASDLLADGGENLPLRSELLSHLESLRQEAGRELQRKLVDVVRSGIKTEEVRDVEVALRSLLAVATPSLETWMVVQEHWTPLSCTFPLDRDLAGSRRQVLEGLPTVASPSPWIQQEMREEVDLLALDSAWAGGLASDRSSELREVSEDWTERMRSRLWPAYLQQMQLQIQERVARQLEADLKSAAHSSAAEQSLLDTLAAWQSVCDDPAITPVSIHAYLDPFLDLETGQPGLAELSQRHRLTVLLLDHFPQHAASVPAHELAWDAFLLEALKRWEEMPHDVERIMQAAAVWISQTEDGRSRLRPRLDACGRVDAVVRFQRQPFASLRFLGVLPSATMIPLQAADILPAGSSPELAHALADVSRRIAETMQRFQTMIEAEKQIRFLTHEMRPGDEPRDPSGRSIYWQRWEAIAHQFEHLAPVTAYIRDRRRTWDSIRAQLNRCQSLAVLESIPEVGMTISLVTFEEWDHLCRDLRRKLTDFGCAAEVSTLLAEGSP